MLESFWPKAKVADREVTLLLAIAAACIPIPWERMREETNYSPPGIDRDLYPEAASAFDALLKKTMSEVAGANLCQWTFAENVLCNGHPDTWPELRKPQQMSKDKKLGTVIKHCRNALAHGGIYTRGNPIQQLVLRSKIRVREDKFNVITVTPLAFKEFLVFWTRSLRGLEVDRAFIAERVEAHPDVEDIAA